MWVKGNCNQPIDVADFVPAAFERRKQCLSIPAVKASWLEARYEVTSSFAHSQICRKLTLVSPHRRILRESSGLQLR
jgi:hypothetical protein